MELNPSSEAASYAAIQELPSILWNLKVHYHVHKSLPLVPIRSQINQSISPHSTSQRSILILSTHLCLGLPSDLYPSSFPTNILYEFLFSPISTTCPPPWLDHSNYSYIQWRVKVMSSSLCSFLQPPITSSLFNTNIFLITLFSNTHSLCSSLNVRDQVSHPYRTTSKIIVVYILIFTLLDSRQEDNRFWTEC
jgi:hypothetical protein